MKQRSLCSFVFLMGLAFLGAGCNTPPTSQAQKSIEAPRETVVEEKQEAIEKDKEIVIDESIALEDLEKMESPEEIPQVEPAIMPVEIPKPTPKPSIVSVPAPAPTPEPVAVPKPMPTPPPVKAICSCPSVDMDCPEFSSPGAAQAVYDCCMDLKGFDVHRLDRDKDGLACELN